MGTGPVQSSQQHRTTRCIIENFQAPQGYSKFTPRPGQLRTSEILFGAGLTFDIVEVEWHGAPAANEPMVKIERSRARWRISEYLNQGNPLLMIFYLQFDNLISVGFTFFCMVYL